jgi:alkaline phosphatase D
MSARVLPEQPVWEQIAAKKPDRLVLLGDSIYLDIGSPVHPQEMDDAAFGRHLFTLYSEQLNQPEFAALIKQLPRGCANSIWDDHDFLWNNALGAEAAAHPAHKDKVRLSTAYQEAFRNTLAQGLAPGSFPADHRELQHASAQALDTPSIALDDDLWLHLCDVRTWRTRTWRLTESKRQLLGEKQRGKISAAVKAAPDAVHLIASGATMSDWQKYGNDEQWLLNLASQHRALLLSGDIRRNETDAIHTGGYPLHAISSAGAAVRDAVNVGRKQQNFGLLEIGKDKITTRQFQMGKEKMALTRTYDRASWLPHESRAG